MDPHHLRAIILKLQDTLSDNDRKRLHFFLGPDIPRRIRDDQSLNGTLSLMESLFDQDKISERDVTFLINAFDEIQCQDAVKILRDHMRQMQAMGQNESIQSLALILLQDQEEDKVARQSDVNFQWVQDGITVAGGNGRGNKLNHLHGPYDVHVDDDQTVYVVDYNNSRIVEWKSGATSGNILVGGNGFGNRNDQLYYPTSMVIDKKNDYFIICNGDNERVIRWPRRNDTSEETIISNDNCHGLAMSNDGYLYISDIGNGEVRQLKIGSTNETVVAGGNGEGPNLNQLDDPYYIFVDQDHSVYVSDGDNHRVVKWTKRAKKGIVIAGGYGPGIALTQLSNPRGIVVDQFGTLYVADAGNHRVMRWLEGEKQGSIVVGGRNGNGKNQLSWPIDLAFDRQNNLYVADFNNARVQKFNIQFHNY